MQATCRSLPVNLPIPPYRCALLFTIRSENTSQGARLIHRGRKSDRAVVTGHRLIYWTKGVKLQNLNWRTFVATVTRTNACLL